MSLLARVIAALDTQAIPHALIGAAALAVHGVLLKLFAGGPQDAWDVVQLLGGDGRDGITAEVEARVGLLPEDSRRLWARIKTE